MVDTPLPLPGNMQAPSASNMTNFGSLKLPERFGLNDKVSTALQKFAEMKGKGAPETPATPQANAQQGFYQNATPAARQALLQAMMSRSRMGRAAPAVVPPTTGA